MKFQDIYEIKLKTLKDNQLKYLIQHIYNKCDMILMAIPNFNRKRILDDEMNKNYKQYLNNIDYILKDIEPYTIYKYYSKKYITSIYTHILDIRLITFYDGFKRILLDSGGFHNWIYPNYPEDLCFFNNEKCYFFSIVHEDIFCIVNPTHEDLLMFDKMKIKYQGIFFEDIYNLEYYLEK